MFFTVPWGLPRFQRRNGATLPHADPRSDQRRRRMQRLLQEMDVVEDGEEEEEVAPSGRGKS